jgi:hypothetical protein
MIINRDIESMYYHKPQIQGGETPPHEGERSEGFGEVVDEDKYPSGDYGGSLAQVMGDGFLVPLLL